MAYLGKEFKLDSHNNYDKIFDSLKIPDSAKQAMLNHKGTLKLVKNGDQYTLSSSLPGGGVRYSTFSSGVEFDEDRQGTKCKTTYTLNGDVLTQEMKFENGLTYNNKWEFSANQVVMTVSNSCEFVATEIYK